MKERVAVDTSDDTHLADEEVRIASEDLRTSSWTATPVAVDTLLTDTRLPPSQQERGAASAAVNTLLTPPAAASSGAATSMLPPDVVTTSAPAPASAPPSTASAAVNKSASQETVEVGDANARVDSGGPHSAVPALDSEILSGVRALNRYPQRTITQSGAPNMCIWIM